MSKTAYAIQVNYPDYYLNSNSYWYPPGWQQRYEGHYHTSLNVARKKKAHLMKTEGWTDKNIRIVEIKRKVVR